MSHRTQAYNTQYGVSRNKDATVPRTARLQTSNQNDGKNDIAKPGGGRMPQPSPSAIDSPGIPSGKARLKPTVVPKPATKSPSLKSTVSPKYVSSSMAVSKPTLAYSSMSQEVPLVMDPSTYSWERNTDANLRRPTRPSDISRDRMSPSDSHLDAIFGTTTARPIDLPPRLIPELQALAASTRHQDYYTKSSSSISSPSTQFSNTPSPWSVSTTTTTPTSWSSASPGIVHQVSMKTASQRSQTVPLPVSKRGKLPKVPALPETYSSLTPSQSSINIPQDKELKKSSSRKRTPLNSPAPTPPPRTSSAKQALSRSSSRSNTKAHHHNLEPTPSSSDLDHGNIPDRSNTSLQTLGDSPHQDSVTKAHNELQQSLAVAPPRPSRRGVLGLEDSRPVIVNTHRAGFSSRHREILDSGDEAPPAPGDSMQKANASTPVLRPTTPGGPEASVQSSPGRLGKFSRLGIFGRRGKSPGTETERSPRKLQRRGPVAGTGHEGYGKYSRRGRKTSQDASSGTSSANNSESERSVSSTRRIPTGLAHRKESSTKRGSQSDIDEFAVPRLKPVPIVGGSGASVSNNSRSQLEVHLTNSNISSQPANVGMLKIPLQSQTSIEQHASDYEYDLRTHKSKEQQSIPSLAVRRSQRFRGETDNFNLPTPIRTEALSAPLYINSQDTAHSFAIPGSTSTPSTTTEHNRAEARHDSREKKPRKLRWNIFRRKETVDPGLEKLVHVPSSSSPEELSVSVSTIPVSRPMPYYAMMDSESEVYANENVGEFLSQVVESPFTSPLIGGYERDEEDSEARRLEDEVLIPSAPVSPLQSFERSPSPVPLQSPAEQIRVQINEKPQKQPRLARVGRIPPVISRQERQHKPSRASFSQPFVRPVLPDSPDMEPNTSTTYTENQTPTNVNFSPSRPVLGTDFNIGETEFLHIASRHGSELSSSSTSEGSLGLFSPTLSAGLPESQSGGMPYRPGIHEPTSPSLDEIWNEYDDFIDHVMSPSQARKSKRFLDAQEGLQNYNKMTDFPVTAGNSPRSKKSKEASNANLSGRELRRTVFMPAMATSATPPVIFPPPTLPERSVGEDIRLRRSKIALALQSSMEPMSPFSIRDIISEYGSYQRGSTGLSERLSSSTAGRSMKGLTMTTSKSDDPVEHSHQENVTLLDVMERNKNPAAQSELHYASLMVAKWLSFGRVLFSPAHDDIHKQSGRHVLVIDGLGNEDWSIYCAVTYEDQKAFIHNLKEKPTTKTSKEAKPPTNAPSNHRRAEVASFYEKFPFPPGFFSSAVLRFPPAMAEAKMKNIIAEARRVLLPGGYLELMLLDLDIVNMGVQTRRAVRELKFKMTTADRQISLRPIIDNIQGVLGARGFSNISRCVVGVPVAGRPNVSGDSSSSSRSSRGSDGAPRRGSGESRAASASPRMAFGGRRGHNLSLNDLIADHSDNADAKIGKIVSTTARRWWQHCFEAAVISDGNLSTSIFADKTVLSECKGRGSSFKMLIAYAQRPDLDPRSSRRRTMSEPAVSAMATLGTHRSPPSTYPGARGLS
ncbi:uncharacterized protein A1O9_04826 [Exophiala aquamarina CBS 119918]|uniref:Methyltransferase type 11 domain-containing protein n=1 Tax=Exophiala aquamarina CBS 119918 TaxID=1182545 RepID=A0A072PKW2_9EURO|nr:uncharacterized protein A1O9_04826 [Exophiala aquamarina CBS 119918]KEF59978.1 hypothetical protein A1O9_04826 [Exophiala aquamarina CBS 119918]